MAELLTDLLERCQHGDPAAYQAIVRRFQGKGLDLASSLIGDRHLAEDAVQNAFLTAFSRMDQLREPAAFAGWFRQIVRTEAIRILRKKNPGQLNEADEPIDHQSPLNLTAERELRRLIQESFNELPETSRRTAAMFYLDEQSCAEVAGTLSIPEGTVRRRLHEARKQLQKILLRYL